MQAVTIAIGKSGIQFFAQQYLIETLNTLFNSLSPPDRTIPIPDFSISYGSVETDYYSKISIALSNGKLQNFTPVFQSLVQGQMNADQPVPIFTLQFEAKQFAASYNWTECYHYLYASRRSISEGNTKTGFEYDPSFSKLAVSVVVQFLYNSSIQDWQITVYRTTAAPPGVENANIPAKSILQKQDQSCFSSHVEDATAQMISAIDFATPINSLISGALATIPGSGNLGDNIVYDFSLSAPDQLVFPNNDGIQMGVKGGASYNGTAFPGGVPPELPLPLPPAGSDTHHVNMYVSNYEIDALSWCYFKAGKLNMLIVPTDLPDPASLKVSNYTSLEPTLKPYVAFVMQAQITQNTAPVTSFQLVYLFTQAVMDFLKKKLPDNVNQLIQAIQGNAYTAQSTLEDFLNSATVPAQFFPTIEDAAKTTAMVLTQDLNFTLQIQNNMPSEPEIKFQVQRVDVLTNLALGINTNNNQTLQFGFANAANEATFISSTIPGFNGPVFGSVVWPVTAEPLYAQNLVDLGKVGTPLPIMQGFHFDFNTAVVGLQEGYVSVLANVLYKN